MTDPHVPEASGTGELQFDNVEYTTPQASALTCIACKREIDGSYYEINSKVVCAVCRDSFEAHLTSGSGLGRFLRAFLFGVGATVAGSLLYWAVLKVTGYNIGLIAIAVGLMVGSAVRSGSRARGGWLYQALAIFLTYTAIVTTFIPEIVAEFRQSVQEQKGNTAPPGPARRGVAARPAAPPAANEDLNLGKSVVGQVLIAILVLVVAYAMPFLAGFQQPITLLIIGFALYEAWKLNKRVKFVINGPYQVGEGGGLAPEGVPGHA